jgi:predicted RNA binding protein YcfA (HicA-like mRNA interferase family)
MSPKLPALTAARMVAILRRHGFEPVRQSGSHLELRHADRDAGLIADDLLRG